jgi:hydrogenase maturation protease
LVILFGRFQISFACFRRRFLFLSFLPADRQECRKPAFDNCFSIAITVFARLEELGKQPSAARQPVLVIGYGNVYCRDDGAGYYVVNALRKRMGIRELHPDEDGMDELGNDLDTLLVHQLIPEIASVAARYHTVVFVDAHTGIIPEEIRVVPVKEEYGFHAVSHHMSPGMFLATARKDHGTAPPGYLVSIKGNDFNFGLGLTDACRTRADASIQKILDLIHPPPAPL